MKAVFWTLTGVCGVLVGCASAPVDPGSSAPRDLAITIHSRTPDSRYTFLELSRDGRLYFAGGREAVMREGKFVTVVTQEQRQRLWEIITRHGLLRARGSWQPRYEKARYEVSIRGGGSSRSFKCGDEQVPGVGPLHDALFEIQAQARYKLPRIQ